VLIFILFFISFHFKDCCDECEVFIGGLKLGAGWIWASGDAWDYADWGNGEPTGPGTCLAMDSSTGGGRWRWNDAICSDGHSFICES
jgi:Lectin C-type domain